MPRSPRAVDPDDADAVSALILEQAHADIDYRGRWMLGIGLILPVLGGAAGWLLSQVLPSPWWLLAVAVAAVAIGGGGAQLVGRFVNGGGLAVICRRRGHYWRPWNPTLPPGRSAEVCRRCRAMRAAAIPRIVLIEQVTIGAGGGRVSIPLGVTLRPGEHLGLSLNVQAPPVMGQLEGVMHRSPNGPERTELDLVRWAVRAREPAPRRSWLGRLVARLLAAVRLGRP